jgi:hypothetical protein
LSFSYAAKGFATTKRTEAKLAALAAISGDNATITAECSRRHLVKSSFSEMNTASLPTRKRKHQTL